MSECLDRKQVIELYEKYHPSLATHVYEFGEELKALPIVKIPIAELDTTEDFAEWIPCSERLPEEIGDYLVTEKISDIAQAVYTSSFGHIRTGELCFYYEDDECIAIKNEGIVAWMPLPEPYKKEGDQE